MSRTSGCSMLRGLGVVAAGLVGPVAFGTSLPGSGLQPTAWLKADAVNGVDASGNAKALPATGAAVGSWVDSSGLGHSAAQGVALEQPKFVTSVVNGKPVVRFDGSTTAGDGDFMTIAGTPWASLAASKLTMFVVANDDRGGTGNINPKGVISTRNGSTGWLTSYEPDSVTQKYVHVATGGVNTESDALGTDSFHLLELRRNGLDVEVGHDGAWEPLVHLAGMNASTAAGTEIGRNDGDVNRFFKGDIAEIVAFDGTTLTDAQRGQVESYLGQKYGIAITTAVPEPGVVAMGVIGAVGLMRRRRR